jgi:multicomponent Na+:H+ antiporter subunit F
MISDEILMGAGMALFAMMATALYRIIAGPTAIDRIVAANVIGTKTAVLLVIIGEIFHDVSMFVDFALAYALLNFIGSLAASRYLHKTRARSGASPPLEPHRDES